MRSRGRSSVSRYHLRLWSHVVKARDKGLCDVCGRVGREAHHFYDKSTYPELALLPYNGVFLCKRHHYAFHKHMGGYRVSCTFDDYIKWRLTISKSFLLRNC